MPTCAQCQHLRPDRGQQRLRLVPWRDVRRRRMRDAAALAQEAPGDRSCRCGSAADRPKGRTLRAPCSPARPSSDGNQLPHSWRRLVHDEIGHEPLVARCAFPRHDRCLAHRRMPAQPASISPSSIRKPADLDLMIESARGTRWRRRQASAPGRPSGRAARRRRAETGRGRSAPRSARGRFR